MAHRINILRKAEIHIMHILDKKSKETEKRILQKICKGRGADIGCGSNKVTSDCIGIDLTPNGKMGKYGNQEGRVSETDYQASGDNLFMFKSNELDFIVAKHNLEHYKDPLNTLLEWKRVLKSRGRVGVIVPDNKFTNTKKLDPTHYSEFDLDLLEKLFLRAGFKVLEKGIAIPHWSIYLIAEK